MTPLARIDREIAAAIAAQSDPALSPAEKLGALQGEMDWRAERAREEESK